MKWTRIAASQMAQDVHLQADWDRLNQQRGDLPFMGSAATLAALEIFGQGREQLLVGRDDGGAAQAMLILEPAGSLRWQTFQPSQQPLGAWVAAAGLAPTTLAHDLLGSGRLGLGLSLSLTQIDPLHAPRAEDDGRNRHDGYIDTAWVDIAGTFDDYWAARGKNLRQNMKKQRNKLQAEGIAVEMRSFEAAADMVGVIQRYGEMEGRSWKAQNGTAITPANEQGRFYTRLLSEAAARGEAVVYELLFDGKTVASNLCLRRGTTLVMLKTTYDEALQSYSAAFLLHQDLVQQLFEQQRIQRLEYYGKVMEWHTRWTENKRELYHLTSFRWGWLKALAARRASAAAQTPAIAPAPATESVVTESSAP